MATLGASDKQTMEWFTYHPANKNTAPLHERVRESFRLLAQMMLEMLPPSAERTIALRELQKAMWAANAAVALEPTFKVKEDPA